MDVALVVEVANGLGTGACDDEYCEANGVFCGGGSGGAVLFDDAPNGTMFRWLWWFITLDDMANVMGVDTGGGGRGVVSSLKPNGFGVVVMDDALGNADDGGTVNVVDDIPNDVGGNGVEESIIDVANAVVVVPKGVIGGGGGG